MNSLKGNVNLRNIVYVPADVNNPILRAVEDQIENKYRQRERVLKNKASNWKTEMHQINKELRSLISDKLPQKFR